VNMAACGERPTLALQALYGHPGGTRFGAQWASHLCPPGEPGVLPLLLAASSAAVGVQRSARPPMRPLRCPLHRHAGLRRVARTPGPRHELCAARIQIDACPSRCAVTAGALARLASQRRPSAAPGPAPRTDPELWPRVARTVPQPHAPPLVAPQRSALCALLMPPLAARAALAAYTHRRSASQARRFSASGAVLAVPWLLRRIRWRCGGTRTRELRGRQAELHREQRAERSRVGQVDESETQRGCCDGDGEAGRAKATRGAAAWWW
jgi:hypothetical protein